MKKCPYCKTLMNDDISSCPNCLKDVSDFKAMPEIVSEKNKSMFYELMFGVLISFGSVAASLSQRANRINYTQMLNEATASYNDPSTSEAIKNELYDKIVSLSANVKTCQFREVFFYITCVLGIVLIVYALIKLFKKKKSS